MIAKSLPFRVLAACGLAAAAVAPLLAAPADTVRARVAGYRELGAAFKAVNDGLRSDPVKTAAMQQAARQIRDASRKQYGWFPAGTGPSAGVKTKAKADIWAKPAQFRAAQDAFARRAEAFEKVAKSTDTAVLRAEVRKLGAACKGCHDTFRVATD